MLRKAVAIVLTVASMLTMTSAAFAADEKVGYVTSTGLYIRKTASTDAQPLRCAENGQKLIILREEGDWYYVQYLGVVYGYVSKKFVSLKKPGSSGGSSDSGTSSGDEKLPDKISQLGSAPSSSKKGDRGNDVKKLQQALKIAGYYSGSCDGIFGEVTEAAVQRFQKSRGLSQDGIAGKVTIKLLFGEDAEDADVGSNGAKTEKLDWFKGGNSVIPKGAYFNLKDVRTGVTLRCKHLFGANHMDAEPATKEDTAKLLRIYGGSWSWDRRPVLLSYNGRVLAGSMNGMPHGEESIMDNNFDGQFCIHFLNSKTHGSDNVDPDHQACVNEAAKAVW